MCCGNRMCALMPMARECRLRLSCLPTSYRGWLADLPHAVAAQVRWEDAARMVGSSQVK
jgi:hypothetical protein